MTDPRITAPVPSCQVSLFVNMLLLTPAAQSSYDHSLSEIGRACPSLDVCWVHVGTFLFTSVVSRPLGLSPHSATCVQKLDNFFHVTLCSANMHLAVTIIPENDICTIV